MTFTLSWLIGNKNFKFDIIESPFSVSRKHVAWKVDINVRMHPPDDIPTQIHARLHVRHAHMRTGNAAATKIRGFARQGYLASGGFKGSRLNVITIIKLSEREWTVGYKPLFPSYMNVHASGAFMRASEAFLLPLQFPTIFLFWYY